VAAERAHLRLGSKFSGNRQMASRSAPPPPTPPSAHSAAPPSVRSLASLASLSPSQRSAAAALSVHSSAISHHSQTSQRSAAARSLASSRSLPALSTHSTSSPTTVTVAALTDDELEMAFVRLERALARECRERFVSRLLPAEVLAACRAAALPLDDASAAAALGGCCPDREGRVEVGRAVLALRSARQASSPRLGARVDKGSRRGRRAAGGAAAATRLFWESEAAGGGSPPKLAAAVRARVPTHAYRAASLPPVEERGDRGRSVLQREGVARRSRCAAPASATWAARARASSANSAARTTSCPPRAAARTRSCARARRFQTLSQTAAARRARRR
jgi:hypothetical protein